MIDKIKKYFLDGLGRISFRRKRAHYASSILKCLRDQYWEWKGVEPTNPSDFLGHLKMAVGEAVEKYLCYQVFPKLSMQGLHLLGTQVPVEGEDPNWHGYIDALFYDSFKKEHLVVEIKTKHGAGADYLWDRLDVPDEHLVQLGLYLAAVREAGLKASGAFLYVLLSDKNFGKMIYVTATLEKNRILTHESFYSTGERKTLTCFFDLEKAYNRMRELDDYLKRDITPPPDYQYKYDLTPKLLKSLSDSKLLKLAKGEIVCGDWQPLYSPYKDLQLKTDKIEPKRTIEERKKAFNEYLRRHPSSKKKFSDFLNPDEKEAYHVDSDK